MGRVSAVRTLAKAKFPPLHRSMVAIDAPKRQALPGDQAVAVIKGHSRVRITCQNGSLGYCGGKLLERPDGAPRSAKHGTANAMAVTNPFL